MAEVKVLIRGYAREIKGVWKASSSCVLINDSGVKILVDPGANKRLLLNKLKEEKLTTSDVDYVFLTHYHLDHLLLISIFEKSKVLDEDTMYFSDREVEFKSRKIPGTNVEIMPTPGHAYEGCSLVADTDKGKGVVAGDVFWWIDREQDSSSKEVLLGLEDPFVKDKKALIESRKKVLKIADWIIPGHGKMFKNPRK